MGGLFLLEGPSDLCLTDATDQNSGQGAGYYASPSAGAAPRFGVFHQESDVPPGGNHYTPDDPSDDPDDPFAARPVGWDDEFPDHDNWPTSGLVLAACQDQDWDATVMAGEPVTPDGIPNLKRTHYAPVGAPDYIGLTLFTDQPSGQARSCGANQHACGPHESVALSFRPGAGFCSCMPDAGGTAHVAPEQTTLFESYVQGFCALGTP